VGSDWLHLVTSDPDKKISIVQAVVDESKHAVIVADNKRESAAPS
jgi:hypothetical protein